MLRLPMLRGKTGASLRALKAHVNAECKQLDRAPLLSEGNGSGASRRHEINPTLGALRDLAIAAARSFEVDWQLLDPAPASDSHVAPDITDKSSSPTPVSPARAPSVSQGKAWYVTRQTGRPEIAAFVNAKGSCSYRRFKTSGEFINVKRSRGEFVDVFSTVVAHGVRFFPNRHPALEDAERNGLPADILDAARTALAGLR
jgi:hypothetical protein